MKLKLIKIISAIILMTGGALAITAGVIVGGNNNDNETVQSQGSITGKFSGRGNKESQITVDYELKSVGSINKLKRIDYTFTPKGGGSDIFHSQTDNFPTALYEQNFYTIDDDKFLNGEVYEGTAKIVDIDGNSTVQDFQGDIIMLAGKPEWGEITIVPYIIGAEFNLSIAGLALDPSKVFDQEKSNIEITNTKTNQLVTTISLTEQIWKDDFGTWKTEVKIKDELEPETKYRADFCFVGNGQELPNNIPKYETREFVTKKKEAAPDWRVIQTSSEYNSVKINISSDNVYHSWHQSLLGDYAPQLLNLKAVGGSEVQEENYKHINDSLVEWKKYLPSESNNEEQKYDETFTINNLNERLYHSKVEQVLSQGRTTQASQVALSWGMH